MLKKILAISGKPGLYKLISGNQRMIIVESLIDGKRGPAYSTEKVIALSDIAMYTDTEEVPLHQVFEAIKTAEKGEQVKWNPKTADDKQLTDYLGKVLPQFDRDRVHTSDIKKLILWYNLLIQNNITEFAPKEEKSEEAK
ncbi:MAG: DUF5606 domain-containing protein [Paludibacteraceae bacterium]|nr:DUF5606 domain-containing protein [Paludibacteraceae bacterium]